MVNSYHSPDTEFDYIENGPHKMYEKREEKLLMTKVLYTCRFLYPLIIPILVIYNGAAYYFLLYLALLSSVNFKILTGFQKTFISDYCSYGSYML